MNDTFKYTLTLSGTSASGAKPQLPGLVFFDILERGTSSNFSFENGKAYSSTSFEYTLSPKKKGSFAIPPSQIKIDGKLYTSKALQIKVVNSRKSSPQRRSTRSSVWDNFGSQGASNKSKSIVTGDVDKHTVYVNEQIVYSFKFYRRMSLFQNPNYIPPDMTGFVVVDLPDKQKSYRQNLDGLVYNVSEIKTALFPTSPGDFKIGEATLNLPGSIFSRGSVSKTEAVKIKVLPLPDEGKPEDFNGVVGKFTIRASLDKSEVDTGQPITLIIIIHGAGNIDNIQRPKIEERPELTFYSSKESKNLDGEKGRIEGSKTFENIIVPQKAGKYSLGRISFAFFDPDKKVYDSVSSKEIVFSVQQSSKAAAPTQAYSEPKKLNLLRKDIEYIQPDVKELSDDSPVYAGLLFWLLQPVPILLLLGAFFMSHHQDKMNTNVAYARLKKAGKITKKLMQEADEALKNGSQEDFFANIYKALTEYIGNKFNLPTAGLTNDVIKTALYEKDISEETVKKIIDCLEKCDIARFASATHSSEDMEEVMNLANNAITEIEKQA